MKRLSIILLLLFAASFLSVAQKSKNQKKQERYQKALKLVEAKQFEFIGRKANPQGTRQIDLTTRINFMRIDGDKAIADMPYFGRAYSGGYSPTDGGINFDAPYEQYSVDKNEKKGRVTITFKVKSNSDTYNCTLIISGIDNVTLTVSSNRRQTISYYGYIKPINEK